MYTVVHKTGGKTAEMQISDLAIGYPRESIRHTEGVVRPVIPSDGRMLLITLSAQLRFQHLTVTV